MKSEMKVIRVLLLVNDNFNKKLREVYSITLCALWFHLAN